MLSTVRGYLARKPADQTPTRETQRPEESFELVRQTATKTEESTEVTKLRLPQTEVLPVVFDQEDKGTQTEALTENLVTETDDLVTEQQARNIVQEFSLDLQRKIENLKLDVRNGQESSNVALKNFLTEKCSDLQKSIQDSVNNERKGIQEEANKVVDVIAIYFSAGVGCALAFNMSAPFFLTCFVVLLSLHAYRNDSFGRNWRKTCIEGSKKKLEVLQNYLR